MTMTKAAIAATGRYDQLPYRRCGNSGLQLPAVSLGLWQAIGSYSDEETAGRILQRAFDLGMCHFDLANVYGSPLGNAEVRFGKILRDLPRDEIIIATKAGYRMWPGPCGSGGGRKHLIASCEASLKRLGVEYVDIFYHHVPDPETPLTETIEALDTLVRQGKVLYAGISNYRDPLFSQALDIAADIRQRLVVNQVQYNLFDRAAERTVLPSAATQKIGVVAFGPLAQGLLTDRYLNGIPADSRAVLMKNKKIFSSDSITDAALTKVRRLNEIAKTRGQSLAQMALAWLLRDTRVTSVLIGASSIQQLEGNVKCLSQPDFSPDELIAIDTACI